MKLTDEQIKEIADKGIAEGKTYTDYAWHYVGEDVAHEIICTAIRQALSLADHGGLCSPTGQKGKRYGFSDIRYK